MKRNSILTLSTVIVVFVGFFTIPWLIATHIFKMELEEFIGGFLSSVIWCGFYIYLTICCILLLTIRKRFAIINKIIKINPTRSVILLISKLHMNLSELVSRNRKIFSFQMAIMLGMTVVNSTFGLFEVYTLSKETLSFEKKYYCFCSAGINLCFLIGISFMLGTSNLIMKESRKTLEMMHSGILSYIKFKNRKILRRIQVLLLQIQQYNANISCGLFKLDWKALMMVSC